MQPHPEIFVPYERLIEIEILGTRYRVPENNSILRCLQYLEMDEISSADLCWNGECLNCMVSIRSGDKQKAVIACRTDATDGMKIVQISENIPFIVDGNNG